MYFDESYNEDIYRKDSVMRAVESCDAMIVVGTKLETGQARGMVGEVLKKMNCPVIEIN